ncbi:MAG: YHS domain-containing protein, partial [Rhodocyclaceae bacterium]
MTSSASGHRHDHAHPHSLSASHDAIPGNATDPVCGMTVPPESTHQSAFAGTPYRFCSSHCKAQFDADPPRYVHLQASAASTDPGVEYTCPMHPEVRQIGPGNCPKFGMALEPVMPDLSAEDDTGEYRDFLRRFWFSLPLTLVVVVLAMAGHQLSGVSPAVSSGVEMGLSIPVVLWAGWPFFVRGAQSVLHRSPNMWTLISLGTGAAFLYSVVATLAPGLFP